MTQPNIVTVENKYTIPKGNVLFNQLLNGIYQGFRPMGNCPGFDLTVAVTTLEHTNSQGGLEVTDFKQATKIVRSAKIVCDNMSIENQKLFISANDATITQAATPVTNYNISLANSGRTYQLGANTSNPAGVRGVSAVAVRVYEGDTASARANSTPYLKGAFYVPATPNAHYYVCTIAGTSAGSPPSFSTTGTTFADGTATFKDLGLIIVPSTTDVNYKLDLSLGLLSVVATGTIAAASAFVASLGVTGLSGVGLNVDYTPTANSRTQLTTSTLAQLDGQLKFIADNPYGDNQDVFIPNASLSASGSLPFVGSAIASMTMDVGVNQPDVSVPALFIDGRPV
jgi:hypothetical protein